MKSSICRKPRPVCVIVRTLYSEPFPLALFNQQDFGQSFPDLEDQRQLFHVYLTILADCNSLVSYLVSFSYVPYRNWRMGTLWILCFEFHINLIKEVFPFVNTQLQKIRWVSEHWKSNSIPYLPSSKWLFVCLLAGIWGNWDIARVKEDNTPLF